MGNKLNSILLDVGIIVGKAFLMMLIWNNLVAADIGLAKISFAGAIGVSSILILYSDFNYSDIKAIQTDMTTTPYYTAFLTVEFYRVILVIAIGVIAYLIL